MRKRIVSANRLRIDSSSFKTLRGRRGKSKLADYIEKSRVELDALT